MELKMQNTHRHFFLWVNLSKVGRDGTLGGEVGVRKAEEALEGEESKMVTGQVGLQAVPILESLRAVAAAQTQISHSAGEIAKNSSKKSEFLERHCCLN